MIVTHAERTTRNRARLDRAPASSALPNALPPARIAFVPFSLDEVEAQPEDAVRVSPRWTRAPACSCSHPARARS